MQIFILIKVERMKNKKKISLQENKNNYHSTICLICKKVFYSCFWFWPFKKKRNKNTQTLWRLKFNFFPFVIDEKSTSMIVNVLVKNEKKKCFSRSFTQNNRRLATSLFLLLSCVCIIFTRLVDADKKLKKNKNYIQQ